VGISIRPTMAMGHECKLAAHWPYPARNRFSMDHS